MFRAMLCLMFCFVAAVPPTIAGNCHVQAAVQTVVVPAVQHIVAVPVQPYYYNYNGTSSANVSTGNITAIPKAGESQYMTKQEFLEAMKMVLAESRGDSQYVKENNPEEIKLRTLIKDRCVTCHQTSPVNWKGTNVPVQFFDANGRWDQSINWDRIVTVTIGGKMPKGGQRLNADEVQLIIKKAESHTVEPSVPAPPVPQQQVPAQPQPPVDANY